MQKRFATFIDKGGTGKTTIAAHLGVAFAKLGEDVLLIDLAGKQGDLSKHFGLWEFMKQKIEKGEDWPNVSTIFQDEWEIIEKKVDEAVENLLLDTKQGPEIIPAHPGLEGLNADLGNIDDPNKRYSKLESFLNKYINHDVVIIDLPGVSNNVTYNGLWAADDVIVPIETGIFETSQLKSLKEDIKDIKSDFHVNVELSAVLPNKFDSRTKLSNEYLENLKEKYPVGYPIPKSQDIRNAAEKGKTVFFLNSPSDTAKRASERFIQNAQFLNGNSQ